MDDYQSYPLKTRELPGTLLLFNQLASTIDYLSRQNEKIRNSTIVAARRQTEGQGRMGRHWQSGFDKGFWFSFYQNWAEGSPPYYLLIFSLALSIRKYLIQNEIDEKRILLKWPNDVLVDGKKICGILLKSVVRQNRIEGLNIGIGLNANYEAADFDDSFSHQSTSLYMLDGKKRDILLSYPTLIYSLDNTLAEFFEGNFQNALMSWRKFSHKNGEEITILDVKGKKIKAKYADVDENGALMVYIDGKLTKMMTADVGV